MKTIHDDPFLPEIESVELVHLLMRVRCPYCRVKRTMGHSVMGKRVTCPKCEGAFLVPNSLLVTSRNPVPKATQQQADQFIRDMGRQTPLDPKRDPDCPDCHGTGRRDSGGTQPWGEAIHLDCECINPRCMSHDPGNRAMWHVGCPGHHWSPPMKPIGDNKWMCTRCEGIGVWPRRPSTEPGDGSAPA